MSYQWLEGSMHTICVKLFPHNLYAVKVGSTLHLVYQTEHLAINEIHLPIALSIDPKPPLPPGSLSVAVTVSSSDITEDEDRICPLDCRTTS